MKGLTKPVHVTDFVRVIGGAPSRPLLSSHRLLSRQLDRVLLLLETLLLSCPFRFLCADVQYAKTDAVQAMRIENKESLCVNNWQRTCVCVRVSQNDEIEKDGADICVYA